MADYQQLPNISLIQIYKQGEKMDRISQLENRKTRFLKLKLGMGDIYILAQSNNDNQYVITIIGSNEEQCDNDCNQNGFCAPIGVGCICNENFIGIDCKEIAQPLLIQAQKVLTFPTSKQITFFYMDQQLIRDYATIRLKFSLPEKYPEELKYALEVRFFRTKALIMQLFDNMQNYFDSFFIDDRILTIKMKILSNYDSGDTYRFIWFAILKEQITVDSLQLKIDTDYEEDDNQSDEISRLLYIIIPTVVGSIIIFLLIIYYVKKRKNQAANYQIPAPINNIINEPEKCGICLEELNIKNVAVVKIQCDHQFHLHCIQDWAKKQINKQSDCPYCRKPFNPNEFK
ncbi:unnamed protein product [Paramecium pentaurelia]|uniref:RING-type domain-containing protein n=1 Tax=Paramecium pentaurelia TaxID=43138 RepID=A0A8S1WNA3_9CILI|nr:unnamed protein product [Paramecium pentaurelia]